MFGQSLKKLLAKTKAPKRRAKTSLREHYSNALDNMFHNREEYLILDTETTGLDDGCRIVELCIMDMLGNVRYCSTFNPQMHMPPATTAFNGISDDMLEGSPLFVDEAGKFVHTLSQKMIIAWNAPFDRKVMEKELSAIFTAPLQVRWCDAMAIYCQVRGVEKGRISLARAVEREGLERSDAHRAQGDCQDVLNVLRKVWVDR